MTPACAQTGLALATEVSPTSLGYREVNRHCGF